jgi:hypothetical protein
VLKANLNIVGSKLMAIDVFSPSGLGGRCGLPRYRDSIDGVMCSSTTRAAAE